MLWNIYRSGFGVFLLVIVGFLLATLVLGSYPGLSKPLIMDEMEFPSVAIGIASTGKPIYYRSEIYPQNVGLWHPPLYIAVYAGWHALLGTSVFVSRSFGLFTGVIALTAIGVFSFFRLRSTGFLAANSGKYWVAITAGLGIASTAPLFIQSAILPDIDTQLLPLLTCLFFIGVFNARRGGKHSIFYGITFITLLALNFFAKLTSPVLLIPAFIMYEITYAFLNPSERIPHQSDPQTYKLLSLARFQNVQAYKDALLSGTQVIMFSIIALFLMITVWFAVAVLWKVDFSLPFTYLLNSANNPGNRGDGILGTVNTIIQDIPNHFRYILQWVGYPPIVFVGIMIIREFTRPIDGILLLPERVALYTFILLLGCMYIVLKPATFDFPKYYPPLFIPLAFLGIELFVSLSKKNQARFVFTILCSQIALYILFFSTRYPLSERDFIYQIYWTYPRLPVFAMWMLLPLTVAMVLNLCIFLPRKQSINGLAVAAVAVTLGWQLVVMQVQMVVPYSTTYMYGENSLTKVSTYLQDSLPKSVIIIAPKDVGTLLKNRWRYIELDIDPSPHFADLRVTHLVLRTNDYYGNTIRGSPDVSAAIENTFLLDVMIENFAVFRRKP